MVKGKVHVLSFYKMSNEESEIEFTINFCILELIN